MHDFKWLRRFHLVHHKSIDTTVLTSFSFHPVESFFQAIILPILFMLIPMHFIAILIILLLMTISAIINHAGVEIYPRSSYFNGFRKYVIGATHHDIHHRHAKKNFGLYFTFWDRFMKTEFWFSVTYRINKSIPTLQVAFRNSCIQAIKEIACMILNTLHVENKKNLILLVRILSQMK